MIDQSRCRTCGAASEGLRCAQPVTLGYERELVRIRTAREGSGPPLAMTTAPCADLCPLSLCIQGYTTHIAAGEYAEALGHIMVRAVLPHSVCRVCDRPCEPACVRASVDEPVAINALKRFVVEWADAQVEPPWTPAREAEHGRTVAVIGAGPSGLSAAHDLTLRGYAVSIFDAAERAGGMLAHGIPAYRLPPEVLERDIERVTGLGVTFNMGVALGRDFTIAGLLEDGADAVYLAFGAHRARELLVEGEGAPGSPPVIPALEYLKAARQPDAPRQPGDVVVIGGGDAAIDAARTSLRAGATSVTIVCIESRENMPALPDQVAAAEREGAVLRPDVRPLGFDDGSIVLRSTPGDHAASEPASSFSVHADLVVSAIGQVPELGALAGDPVRLELTEDGHVEVDPETQRTSDPRVFAGGDLVPGQRTVTNAIAHGLRAAWAIDGSLRGTDAADLRPPPRHARRRVAAQVPPMPTTARRSSPELAPDLRVESGAEVVGTMSEEDARAEAARCVVCGACANCRACVDLFGCPAIREVGGVISIDASLCNGCAVCASFCPNGAIVPGEPS